MIDLRNMRSVIDRYASSYVACCVSCNTKYDITFRKCPKCKSKHQRAAIVNKDNQNP